MTERERETEKEREKKLEPRSWTDMVLVRSLLIAVTSMKRKREADKKCMSLTTMKVEAVHLPLTPRPPNQPLLSPSILTIWICPHMYLSRNMTGPVRMGRSKWISRTPGMEERTKERHQGMVT